MLTLFGKEIRKLRIERSMKLSTMAEGLEVTPSFITALETGRKTIPQDFPKRVVKFLKGNEVMLKTLEYAAHISKNVHKLEIVNERDREVVAMFARAFPKMNDEERKQITGILGQIEMDF